MEVDVGEIRISGTERKILSVISNSNFPLTTIEIVRKVEAEGNVTKSDVNRILYSMEKRQIVRQSSLKGAKPCWAAGQNFNLCCTRNPSKEDSRKNSVDNINRNFIHMSLKHKDFTLFCEEVIKELSSISSPMLDKLKSLFSEEIDSRRTLSGISTVKELLMVLQDRGCFTESNVIPLFAIANELKLRRLFDLTKEYAECDDLLYCDVCHMGEPLAEQKTISPSKTGGVEIAIIFLCTELGRSWESLCCSLGMRDDDINSCRSLCRCGLREKAYQALMKWKRDTNGASVEHLIKALKSEPCQREDLARILREGAYYT